MKNFKRVFGLILLISGVFLLASCGKKEETKREKNEQGYYEGSIEVIIVDLGYGSEWLEKVVTEYEDIYPGAKVNIEKSHSADGTKAIIKSTANTSDIVVSTGSLAFEEKNGYLVDLSQVLNSKPEGETKTIGEKMTPSFKEYFTNDKGEIYQMPWQVGYTGIAYNNDSLNTLLGEGTWSLPRTTNELFEFGDKIKAAGGYPFSVTTSQSYWELISYTWWAQYEGIENYNNFWYGKYDNNGTIELANTDEKFETLLAQKGRIRMYEVLERIMKPANGYVHKNADSMSYLESQIAFLGLGYGEDKKKAPMLVIGDWIYNEMISTIQRPEADSDIRFMAAPVISSIVETLEDKNMSDETLRNVIDAVDRGETSYPSVSEKDFNKIKQARKMANVTGESHVIGVPKIKSGAQKHELINQFLTFLFSNYAQEICVQNNRGLAMPYGFDTTTLTNLTPFAKSVNELTGDSEFIVVTRNRLSPLVYGASFMPLLGYAEGAFFTSGDTPQAVMNRLNEIARNSKGQIMPLIK
jgi:spermidine/putrescine-binding protein